MLQAALGGQHSCLFAYGETGYPWDKTACANAARNGHLEVIQWLRAKGCPWDKTTCNNAALGGHLEMLKWARANCCPWDAEKCASLAAENGRKKLKAWIVNASPGTDITANYNGLTPPHIAARDGRDAVERALIKAGADVNKAKDKGEMPLHITTQHGHQAVMRAPIEADANIHKALHGASMDVAKALNNAGYEGSLEEDNEYIITNFFLMSVHLFQIVHALPASRRARSFRTHFVQHPVPHRGNEPHEMP